MTSTDATSDYDSNRMTNESNTLRTNDNQSPATAAVSGIVTGLLSAAISAAVTYYYVKRQYRKREQTVSENQSEQGNESSTHRAYSIRYTDTEPSRVAISPNKPPKDDRIYQSVGNSGHYMHLLNPELQNTQKSDHYQKLVDGQTLKPVSKGPEYAEPTIFEKWLKSNVYNSNPRVSSGTVPYVAVTGARKFLSVAINMGARNCPLICRSNLRYRRTWPFFHIPLYNCVNVKNAIGDSSKGDLKILIQTRSLPGTGYGTDAPNTWQLGNGGSTLVGKSGVETIITITCRDRHCPCSIAYYISYWDAYCDRCCRVSRLQLCSFCHYFVFRQCVKL